MPSGDFLEYDVCGGPAILISHTFHLPGMTDPLVGDALNFSHGLSATFCP